MPNKTQEYLNLAQQTAKELTRYWENWTDYLTTASRRYKYSFADQLMIYAQRPDATACASFDIWNNRMNRYVRRGSKGIALLDQSSSVPCLHYVFDVSDTGVRRNSRDPEVWQLGPDLVQPVSEMLAREYGVYHERLSQQISDLTGKLVDSYWDNNSNDILNIINTVYSNIHTPLNKNGSQRGAGVGPPKPLLKPSWREESLAAAGEEDPPRYLFLDTGGGRGLGAALRPRCLPLDSIVEEVVRQIFAQFREVSRKKLLESVKTNDAARIQKKVKKIQKDLESKQKELDDLKAETILVIRGVSALDKELLGTLVAEAREALETLEKQLVQAQDEYEEATKTAKRSNYICNELFTWADVYDTANHDERRAILQQFIKEIRVRKDYEISITLNASFNQVEQLKAVSTYDGAEIFEGISERGA